VKPGAIAGTSIIFYNYLCAVKKENMSKFIEKLQKAAKETPPPIGFGTARKAALPTRLLLIVSLDPGEPAGISGMVAEADAAIIESEEPISKAVQKTMGSVSGVPWGVSLEDDDDKKVNALIEAGCDFLVFPADKRIAPIPRDDKTGKVLAVESSMDDSLLRAINFIPVDAVLLTDEIEGNGSMIWHQLMIFQHIANLLTKPLLVQVPVNITEPEIKALWDAGVDGVIAARGAEAGALSELRKMINALPARARQKSAKPEAVLPRATGGRETSTYTPDEEEEEDE
jgi:hypothetical protein